MKGSKLLGGGTDGMLYQSLGLCSDSHVGVSTTIVMANGRKTAQMTKQNCQTLSQPVDVDVTNITTAMNDSTVLSLNGKAFDQQSDSGTQKITVQFCQSSSLPSVQATIWQISGHDGGFFGNVTLGSGTTTGSLSVTSATNDYATTTGQSSQFDLKLGSGATLTYAINGGSPSTTAMNCSTQSMPPPPPASSPIPAVGSITSGGQLTLSDVGPAAIGITSFKSATGSQMNDGESYPFAQPIAGSATYDGVQVNGPHLLIQGYSFSGVLDIYTSQTVVIRGSQFRFTNQSWNIGVRPGAGKVYVLYSDLGGSTKNQANIGLNDMQGGAFFYRNHISQVWQGIRPANGGIAVENLIDGFIGSDGDGIVLDTVSNVSVVRNKILLKSGSTCALCLYDDYGPGNAIAVDANYFAGGGYTVYGGGTSAGQVSCTNVSFTNNVFGFDFNGNVGQWGPLVYWASTPGSGNVWQNNSYSDGSPLTSYPSGDTIPSN